MLAALRIAVDGVEQRQPALFRFDGRRAGPDLVIGKRNLLHAHDEPRIAPKAQVGRLGKPNIETVLSVSRINRHRALQSDIAAADFFREQHHIAVIRNSERQNLDLFKIVRDGDAAAQTVLRVYGEADIASPVHDGQPRIINAQHIGIVQSFRRHKRCVSHIPVLAVVARCNADHDMTASAPRRALKVVAEHHDVFPAEFRDAGVIDTFRLIGNILLGKDGRAAVIAVYHRT